MFDTQENEIVKAYGDWMRASLRRLVKPIGAKWLRNGLEGGDRRSNGETYQNFTRGEVSNQNPLFSPSNKEADNQNLKNGGKGFQNTSGGLSGITEAHNFNANIMSGHIRKYVSVIESKKCRTDNSLDAPLGLPMEVMMDFEDEEYSKDKQQ